MGAAPDLPIPSELRAGATRSGRTEWLASLPGEVRDAATSWSLAVHAPYEPGGQTAWVAPATSPDHGEVVLKVCYRHPEGEHEADGLRAWDGHGAVRVLEAAATQLSQVLLLERCVPGTTLWDLPGPAQDEVLGALLPRLWIEPPAGHPFRPLSEMCDQWADECEARGDAARAGIDPGLAAAGLVLFRELPRTADRCVLLCTDLHGGNVLAAAREPWLAIDPKPYVGDPAYDALQHLVNCPDRLHADPYALVRRYASLLDLDADRVRTWLFARCVADVRRDWPWLPDLVRRVAP